MCYAHGDKDHELTRTWDLRSKEMNRLINAENTPRGARWEGAGGWVSTEGLRSTDWREIVTEM